MKVVADSNSSIFALSGYFEVLAASSTVVASSPTPAVAASSPADGGVSGAPDGGVSGVTVFFLVFFGICFGACCGVYAGRLSVQWSNGSVLPFSAAQGQAQGKAVSHPGVLPNQPHTRVKPAPHWSNPPGAVTW